MYILHETWNPFSLRFKGTIFASAQIQAFLDLDFNMHAPMGNYKPVWALYSCGFSFMVSIKACTCTLSCYFNIKHFTSSLCFKKRGWCICIKKKWISRAMDRYQTNICLGSALIMCNAQHLSICKWTGSALPPSHDGAIMYFGLQLHQVKYSECRVSLVIFTAW